MTTAEPELSVVVPVRDNNADAATKTAIDFVRSVFGPLAHQLPS